MADRSDAADRGHRGMAGVDEADIGRHHAATVAVVRASEAATGVAGRTLAIAGDTVSIVSGRERDRTLSSDHDGGWSGSELADGGAELIEAVAM